MSCCGGNNDSHDGNNHGGQGNGRTNTGMFIIVGIVILASLVLYFIK